LFRWLTSGEAGCSLFELPYVPGEGLFSQLLVEQFTESGITPFLWECFTRAFFRPLETADRYLSLALTTKQRSEARRRARLLSESGPLEFSVLEPDGDLSRWNESFLKLEASGWKGREGSALACRGSHRAFFLEATAGAFQRNRLLMPAVLLGGTPIAQNSFFLAGHGCFYFKTGFDEQYAKFAPGFHLECETIRCLHSRPGIDWMDTCTGRDNELYNRLFLDRRSIQTLLVPVRGGVREVAVSLLPALRSMKRAVKGALRPASEAKTDREDSAR
jgi:hypothetical protein